VLDLLTSLLEDDPYNTLKERLQSSHELTDYQRIEQLLAMDALGTRKLSLCCLSCARLVRRPANSSPSISSTVSPRSWGIMQGDDDHQEVLELAKKADCLWAIYRHRQFVSVASVAQPATDPLIHAIRGGSGGNRRAKKG